METYKIKYYTDMMNCCYQQIGGLFTLNLTEENVDRLNRFIKEADGNFDSDSGNEILTVEFKDMLLDKIQDDFNYTMASSALCSISYCDLYDPSISEEEWDAMDRDEQVRYLMETSQDDGGGFNNVWIDSLVKL